jgi:hypothetical protein
VLIWAVFDDLAVSFCLLCTSAYQRRLQYCCSTFDILEPVQSGTISGLEKQVVVVGLYDFVSAEVVRTRLLMVSSSSYEDTPRVNKFGLTS